MDARGVLLTRSLIRTTRLRLPLERKSLFSTETERVLVVGACTIHVRCEQLRIQPFTQSGTYCDGYATKAGGLISRRQPIPRHRDEVGGTHCLFARQSKRLQAT